MKWLRRFAFALAALITLTVLVLAIEGWRARRAWLACQQEMAAKGEKLDWVSLAPPPVPDERNFLATPSLAPCFGFGPAPDGASDTNACEQLQGRFSWVAYLPQGNWRRCLVSSLSQWQEALRATNDPALQRQILQRYGLPEDAMAGTTASPATGNAAWEALQARPPGTPLEDLQFLLQYERAFFDELRAAARRPLAQLRTPTDLFSGELLPWVSTLKALTHVFRVSCRTELAAGNPEAAAGDFQTLLALSEAAGSQPLLIGVLVKIALLELAIQPLWAGLAEHRWPDAQLAAIEARLARLNVVADLQRGLRGERAFALVMLGAALDRETTLPGTENPYRTLMRYWPRAFVYRNQINVARAYQRVLLDRLDPTGPAVRVALAPEDEALRKRFSTRSPYNLFAALLLPAVERSLQKAAVSQTTVNLARVACALERHRLATGAYPEKLDELAPRYLARIPPDPVNGGALNYRRDAPDRFLLYSVGLDGKDDGGLATPTVREAKPGEMPAGDWVWCSHPQTAQ